MINELSIAELQREIDRLKVVCRNRNTRVIERIEAHSRMMRFAKALVSRKQNGLPKHMVTTTACLRKD